eukprot:4963341-Alexandrium_andersonii.AAC.1
MSQILFGVTPGVPPIGTYSRTLDALGHVGDSRGVGPGVGAAFEHSTTNPVAIVRIFVGTRADMNRGRVARR